MSQNARPLTAVLAVVVVSILAVTAQRGAVSREANSPSEAGGTEPSVLRVAVTDAKTGKLTPARFSLTVDGKPYFPRELNAHGLRFVSVHESKRQTYVVLYARGTGVVECPLPKGAKKVAVAVAKGLEFLPARVTKTVAGASVAARVALSRWTNQAEKGWLAADEHVHYDRLKRSGDKDWLTMMAADDLACAHFMVLKGGKVPGIWARQYAYGKAGEAFDGKRLIRSGEEYRDSAQGHINLLGLKSVIRPISTGGLGKPPVFVNYPPLLDVFQKNRKLGGLGGVGPWRFPGTASRRPLSIRCSAGVDFFEIGNSHLYSLGLWYRLMNCGYNLPPAAGTDLPNYPDRDPWQPFLGGMRMYVKTKGRDFESWKTAVRAGRVIVTSGPILSVTANGAGPGDVVRLPTGGGEVTIVADLASPVGLKSLELVQSDRVVAVDVKASKLGSVHRRRFRKRLKIRESCWLAVRGGGVPILALQKSIKRKNDWTQTEAVAHSAAIRVIVGGKPIRSQPDARALVDMLGKQREYYRLKGRYQKAADRARVLSDFEKAVAELESRGGKR